MTDGGDIFLLNMGEPVRVLDLATNMVHLSDLSVRSESNPEADIEIRTIGLRPGEKLYEELLIESIAKETSHPRIMRAQEHFITLDEMVIHIGAIRRFLRDNDQQAANSL